MKSSVSVKFKNSKWLIAVVAALIILGMSRGIFSLAALVLCAFTIALSREEDSMSMLMFILPFANVFKMSPGSQSFFTYLILFYILYMAVTKRRIEIGFFITVTLLTVWLMALSLSSFNALRLIKFIANFFIVYTAMKLNVVENHKGIFLSYILGLISSSLIVLMGLAPNLSAYMTDKNLGLANDWLIRFSGLYGDPNYYAVNVIISMCLIVILLHKKELNPFVAVAMTALLVYFAIITYSKSALLMLLMPMLLFVYSKFKSRNYFWTVVFAIALGYVVFLAVSGKISVLDTVMARFSDGGGDVTTGRSVLWKSYLEYFRTNPLNFVSGTGLGAPLINNTAPHNTYIDFVYYLGLFGILLVSSVIWTMPKPKFIDKRNVMNCGVLICVAIMYFFLSEIFYIDLPFHIVLVMIALYLPMDAEPAGGEK